MAQRTLAHAKECLEPWEPEGVGGISRRLQKHHGPADTQALNFWISIVRKKVCLLLRYRAHGRLLWKLWEADYVGLLHHLTKQGQSRDLHSSTPHTYVPCPPLDTSLLLLSGSSRLPSISSAFQFSYPASLHHTRESLSPLTTTREPPLRMLDLYFAQHCVIARSAHLE